MNETTREEVIEALSVAEGLVLDLIDAAGISPFKGMLIKSLESQLTEFQRLGKKLKSDQPAMKNVSLVEEVEAKL